MTGIDPQADLERLIAALHPKKSGDNFSAKCPAHEDKENSLGFRIKDGKLVWKCYAGCSQEAVYDAFVAQGVLEKPQRVAAGGRHLRAYDGGKAQPNKSSLGTVIATYDYFDLTGTLVHQTIKFAGKQFRQRRRNSAGEWVWKLDGITPILYRLSEVVEAETVYVCEGEKDVETLRALKLVATCNPMGAGKWRDVYSAALAGKHVVVLPDNDNAGRKHAEQVAASVFAAGVKSVRVVELPGLPEHGDVTDWLEHGRSRDELEAFVRTATPLGRDGKGDPGWRTRLIKGDKGPTGNEANVEIALRYAPELVGRLRFDEFRTQLQCMALPWDDTQEWRDWKDTDDVYLSIMVQRQDINIQPHRVAGVAEAVGRMFPFHPVRDYLTNLKWDGVPRLENWLITYAGAYAPDEKKLAYVRSVGKRFMLSAVARIMVPGCKVDTLLILEGVQGLLKSTLVRVLFGTPYFTDQISDFSSKDYAIDLRGKWCVEWAELTVMNKSEANVLKSVISRMIDHYRPPYGRRSIDVPRQSVFVATTNKDEYLADETGNRRYWPIKCLLINIEAVIRDRDQLWAEAMHLYNQGETWYLSSEEDKIAKVEQADRLDHDVWSPWIDDYLNRTSVQLVTTGDILLHLGVDKQRMNRALEMRIAKHLIKLGWTRVRTMLRGQQTWCYRRPPPEPE